MNRIQIAPAMLDQPDIVLDAVMYHELGHCQLGLQHSSDEQSMMFPSLVLNANIISAKWDQMVQSICPMKGE